MNSFGRIKKGWKIGWTSLEVIRDNPGLLVFVVFSGTALITVLVSFLSTFYLVFGIPGLEGMGTWFAQTEYGELVSLISVFLFYLIAFFIISFANVALVYCAKQVFNGEEVSIKDGFRHSMSKVDVILPWAAFAATIGAILRMLSERLGFIGQIVISLLGAGWSIASFFVIPILAHEDIGPIDSLKKSVLIMKDKWGEAFGANFSFGAFYILGYIAIVSYFILLVTISPWIAFIGSVILALFLHTAVSAAKMVFIAASYQHATGQTAGIFDDAEVMDDIFRSKNRMN